MDEGFIMEKISMTSRIDNAIKKSRTHPEYVYLTMHPDTRKELEEEGSLTEEINAYGEKAYRFRGHTLIYEISNVIKNSFCLGLFNEYEKEVINQWRRVK